MAPESEQGVPQSKGKDKGEGKGKGKSGYGKGKNTGKTAKRNGWNKIDAGYYAFSKGKGKGKGKEWPFLTIF
eukprot:11037467-Karenia_brevis.AAC.1